MELHLTTNLPEYPFDITLGDKIVLMGSCFSNEMTDFFVKSGLEALSNPFGVLFHPFSIAELLKLALDENEPDNIFQREDLFLSWSASSTVFSFSEDEIRRELYVAVKQLRDALVQKNSKLIITFGTAFGYYLKADNSFVANCHKMPADLFRKELAETNDMIELWIDLVHELENFNHDLEIIFTVSPVRHAKDGLIENNRSKARLIETVHTLCERTQAVYFPAYEIVVDELRDHRFYKDDLVHPTETAVKYVWERFFNSFMSRESVAFKEIYNYHRSTTHRSIHQGSEADQKRIAALQKKQEELVEKYPLAYLS
jgi:hypothetical protein